ncbi:hypothetical protein TOPH_06711 [Tolypocladium ophioglossoides CBS 100239]|uniref:Uncharacterized protein n=1 Tax=Tolypocladium ophioglossoides (strain CBS 100239) TaxID=1163406 RepID=A0A0L0N3I0_TOLOC|nr:hypothetical protein TOPH_06711 [Tolypocladium ophioglossoides CBS 100239]
MHDVPSWLLLASPHCWLDRDDKAGFDKWSFSSTHEVEQAEAAFSPLDWDEPPLPLSARMRESWRSGRFWFNFAMRTSLNADVVY